MDAVRFAIRECVKAIADREKMRKFLTASDPINRTIQPYGCREFGITDLDGYDIAFGQDIE